MHTLYDRVIAGLTDHHDVCAICILIVTKLIHMAPEEYRKRLNEFTEVFRQVLTVKPKENAVKTEIDRLQESQKGILKVSILVQRGIIDGSTSNQILMPVQSAGIGDPGMVSWKMYWEWVKKNYEPIVKDAEEELQQIYR